MSSYMSFIIRRSFFRRLSSTSNPNKIPFYHSELPDGDVPDVSREGLPKGVVKAFLNNAFKGESSAPLPLGRWKVNSCDEVLETKDKPTLYDNCAVTIDPAQVKKPNDAIFYNTPLPDGDVPDVSLTGLPIRSLVVPFMARIFEKEKPVDILLGRWKVKPNDLAIDPKLAVNTYDHCGTDVVRESKPAVFYNTPLPDGDVPDLSQAGLPLKSIVVPFISKAVKGSQEDQLPLGRWKVKPSDDFRGTPHIYDHSA